MTFARPFVLEHGAAAVREAAKVLIGSATGCDARFNGEPINHLFYARLREWDRKMRAQVNRAKKLWRLPR